MQYTHEHSETGTAGVHDTLGVDFSVSPVDDDALNLITQRLQIWRYRLYGAKNEDPDTGTTAPKAYYEVYVPLGATNGWYGGKGVDD